MQFRANFALLLSALTVSVTAEPMFETQEIKGHAPLISAANTLEHEIPNNYMVIFKAGIADSDAADHHSWVTNMHASSMHELRKRSEIPLMGEDDTLLGALTGLKHTYKLPGFAGYSGAFDDATLTEIRKHPDVAYVEKDFKVYALEEESNVHTSNVTQHSAPWGLARVSHQDTLDFGSFNKYIYNEDGGEGVDAYVVDTGTNIDHVDFEGRAFWGKTIPAGDADEDGNGHGTHCSGTVAGKKYGLAKKANVYAVKVLRSNGSGTMSDVVKGVEYVAEAHSAKVAKKDPKFKGSVANMSLGGGKSPSLDMAVNAVVDHGVVFAVAAGNDNADACNSSPAAAEKAITVGASTLGDERAYFSNYGKCVDIFAPGLNIQSTWIGSEYAINTISGTSMASPHIAGLSAYFLSLAPKGDSGYSVGALSPAALKKNMISVATEGILTSIPEDTVNKLAWNGGGSGNLSDIFDGKGKKFSAPSTPLTEVKIPEPVQRLEEVVEEMVEKLEKVLEKEAKLLQW